MLFLEKVSVDNIKNQWDSIAELRFEQQRLGRDLSYVRYLKPTVLKFLEGKEYYNVLDLGCGNGDLTQNISRFSKSVVGLDFSIKNIELAKNYNYSKNIKYICEDAGEYLNDIHEFDVIVANMFLQDYHDLDGVINKIYNNLISGGVFIFTITHPLYWPKYWGYDKELWFDYNREIIIEAPFKISSESIEHKKTVHFHRPLEIYEKMLSKVGFEVDRRKDISTKDISSFQYPKFLAMKCIK